MAAEVRLRSILRGLAPLLLVAGCATPGPQSAPPRPAGTDAEALALVAQAQYRLEEREIAEGLELFRRAIALAPGAPGIAEEYGLALAGVGLADQAVEQLRGVQSLSPSGEAVFGMLLAQAAEDETAVETAVSHLRKGVDAVPEGVSARVALVQALIRLERGEEAWQALQPMLAERPGDPRVQLLAGQALREAGRFDEAIGYLRGIAATGEGSQRAALELVETLTAAGRYKEAADELGTFLKREGSTLAGLTRYATLLARAGESEHAREVLDDVLSRDPNFREGLLLKALLEASAGNLDEAERLYRRQIALDPDDLDARLGLVRVLTEARHMSEARAELDALWQKVFAAEKPMPEAVAEVAQEGAALELTDHQPEAARGWLGRIPAQPVGRRTLALWSECYRLREAWTEGLAWLEAAALDEQEATARLRAGVVAEFLLATGNEGRAKEALDSLRAGGEEDALTAIGALQRRQRYAETVQTARDALARFPESSDLLFALAASLERSGAFDEAVERFRELIAREPDNASALNYLGYMFADKGTNLEEALELIRKAVDEEPSSGAYLDSLGWVYFKLGDLDRAEKYLTDAVRFEPFDATVQEHLGELHLARGNRPAAEAAFRRALASRPEEAGQKERIEARLVSLAGAKER
jgi:tetratricopeptide (TPR) repeat protein